MRRERVTGDSGAGSGGVVTMNGDTDMVDAATAARACPQELTSMFYPVN